MVAALSRLRSLAVVHSKGPKTASSSLWRHGSIVITHQSFSNSTSSSRYYYHSFAAQQQNNSLQLLRAHPWWWRNNISLQQQQQQRRDWSDESSPAVAKERGNGRKKGGATGTDRRDDHGGAPDRRRGNGGGGVVSGRKSRQAVVDGRLGSNRGGRGFQDDDVSRGAGGSRRGSFYHQEHQNHNRRRRGHDDDGRQPTSGRDRGRGRLPFDKRGSSRFSSSEDDDEKAKEEKRTTAITVARGKGGGGGKYCYGCGATIVAKSEQQEEGNSTVGGRGGVSMGLKSQRGGYWQEKKDELKISKLKNWGLCARCKNLKNQNQNNEQWLEAVSPSHEMTQVFREQVSKIRKKEDAVAVLCVDAVNVKGSLINTLRNYVGGNPILLAVTRCDLLPDYITKHWSTRKEQRLKDYFAKQAAHLHPADVYLCSVNDDENDDEQDNSNFFNGTQELADDLWHYLDGRDTYIVGAANLGKSTLTDRLIDEFVSKQRQGSRQNNNRRQKPLTEKEKKKRRYAGRTPQQLDERRLEKILESRVTKSSLPGTTLQNVRVPCFPNHEQALWDTPGLLLDPSVAHFPTITNFRQIKAQRPNQIQSQFHEVDNKKSFALQVYDDQNDNNDKMVPLLRVEIRLRRKEENDGKEEDLGPPSVHLVWNSTLDILSTNVCSIKEAMAGEHERMENYQNAREKEQEQATASSERSTTSPTEKPRIRDKEQRKRDYLERVKAEKKELGLEEWNRREEARKQHEIQMTRLKALAQPLQKASQDEELTPGTPMEIDIAHFGSIGILSPRRSILVRVFAPKTGIQITTTSDSTMMMPPQWEDFIAGNNNKSNDDSWEGGEHDDDFDDDDESFDDDWGYDDEFAGEEYDNDYADEYGVDDYHSFENGYGFDHDYHHSFENGLRRHDDHQRERNSVKPAAYRKWSEFSGESIGWEFDEKRYVRGEILDGWFPIEKKKEEQEEEERKKGKKTLRAYVAK